jgi:hypothetical protein
MNGMNLNGAAELITISQLAKLTGLSDETIKTRLKGKVNPLFQRPMGRGMSYYFNKSDALPVFAQELAPKAPPAPAKSVAADQVLMKRLDDVDKTIQGAWRDLDDLSKFTRIDVVTKLDVMLKGQQVMWKAMEQQQSLMKEILDFMTKPRS